MDEFVAVDGPAGRLFAAWNRRGVSFVTLTEDVSVFAERFADHFSRPLRAASRPPVALVRALETGEVPPSLRLDLNHLRPFPRAVLEATRRIPYGEVRTYAWVATEAGNPAAVRAAGTALGRNPVPFLVPCHRVIRSDGTVGHYGFGTDRKRALLTAEGVDLAGVDGLLRPGDYGADQRFV
ncbi:MAG: MGMT family protein [Actinomycetota bacterium]|nr:MGMT family protein [Actinomycetota bacterium]